MAEEIKNTTTQQITPADRRAPKSAASSRSPNSRRKSGYSAGGNEDKQFDERTLHIDRVARVVMGGRRFRFRALVVVGDHKGRVGVGISKGPDVSTAVTKASNVAKKNIITVPLNHGTLPHDIETKVSGAKVFLKPAGAGTGIIAGGVIRTILEVTGVTDILSKSLGSSNHVNVAYATIEALRLQVPAKDWVTNSTNNHKTPTSKSKATPNKSVKKSATGAKTK